MINKIFLQIPHRTNIIKEIKKAKPVERVSVTR